MKSKSVELSLQSSFLSSFQSSVGSFQDVEAVRTELLGQIESRAVYLLAMREHGDLELVRKLNQKFLAAAMVNNLVEALPDLVDLALQRCQDNHYQSDERYIEVCVRQMMEKGRGAIKIRQTLLGRTSHQNLVSQALAFDDEIWIELAVQVLVKKYGDAQLPKHKNEQAKRMRFLQSRGFSSSQIYKAFK